MGVLGEVVVFVLMRREGDERKKEKEEEKKEGRGGRSSKRSRRFPLFLKFCSFFFLDSVSEFSPVAIAPPSTCWSYTSRGPP